MTRLRSAEVGPDPDGDGELEKILVYLPADNWSGSGGERLWAKSIGESLYEIRNTPWYAKDINWGDTVRCEGLSAAGLPEVAEVVARGDHWTLRVMFPTGVDDGYREGLLARVVAAGGTYENADGTLYSIDIAPGVEVEPILDLLAVEEGAERLQWETGWT